MQIRYSCYFLVLAAINSLVSCTASKQILPTSFTPTFSTMETPANITDPFINDTTRTDPFMETLLKQYPQYFDSILADRKGYNVQIIYTQVDRGANGIPLLQQHYFNVNPDHYFYPASTVKFPVSLLALQRLNELEDKGIDKNTTMLTQQAANQPLHTTSKKY
jgi:beta-lactamase class A